MTTNDTNGRLGGVSGVVAGFDGSDQARKAVFWAVDEATSRDHPLLITQAHLVPVATVGHAWGPIPAPAWGANASLWDQAHLFDDQRVREHNERALTALAEECRARAPELTVSTVMEDGPAQVVLSATAVNVGADLLVVGASGLGALPRMLVGSTAADVVHSADRPVVVARDAPAEDDAPVVVGVDGTDASERAVGFAFDFAARHGAALTAVHARSDWPLDMLTKAGLWNRDTDRAADTTDPLADKVLGPWQRRHPDVPVRIEFVDDRPAQALLERSERARLLVVGSRGRGAVRRVLLGSVSHAALYHASCPVAIVPSPEGDG